MLAKLRADGFKSLIDFEIEFPQLTVLFGPNAAGKSNILEATQMLSRCGTARTLADVFDESIRGYPLEAFSFGPEGLPGLVRSATASLTLEARLATVPRNRYDYRIELQVEPGSGALSVQDEYLVRLTKRDNPDGAAQIEKVNDKLHVRRKGKPAHPWGEPVGRNHSCLSDLRYTGDMYKAIEECRKELDAWRVYYLDPRVAMRAARPPADVSDIGLLGEDLAPYLYRLKAEDRKRFDAVQRTLRSVIPSVRRLHVDLDEKRGTLDIQIVQDQRSYSSRLISEGTLRVLALCSIVVNPWARGLVAFEEPENGVHPRRLELIAQLLVSLALEHNRQVIVTTHSPVFCGAVLRLARQRQTRDIGLYAVHRDGHRTAVSLLEYEDTLFQDAELAEKLTSPTEDGLFQEMMLRGWLDE